MNKKYLLVRAKPDNKDREDQFLKGILSIGWPNTGEFKEFSRRYLENLLENFEYNKTAITQIESFINLEPGDIVLTPSKNKTVYIFEVLSKYNYVKDNIEDGNPHVVKAKLVKEINMPEKLSSVIKASRRAVTNLYNYAEIIEKLINPTFETLNDIENENISLALETLNKLLNDEKSEIRLQAALGLLSYYKKS